MNFLDVVLWALRIISGLFFLACLVAIISNKTLFGGWIDPGYAKNYLVYCALVESAFLNYLLIKKLKKAEGHLK